MLIFSSVLHRFYARSYSRMQCSLLKMHGTCSKTRAFSREEWKKLAILAVVLLPVRTKVRIIILHRDNTVALRHVRMQLAFNREVETGFWRRQLHVTRILELEIRTSLWPTTQETFVRAMLIKCFLYFALLVIVTFHVGESIKSVMTASNESIVRTKREDTKYLVFPQGSNVQVRDHLVYKSLFFLEILTFYFLHHTMRKLFFVMAPKLKFRFHLHLQIQLKK